MRSDYESSLEALQGKMKHGNFDFPSLKKKISASLWKNTACRQSSIEKDMAGIEQSSTLLGLSEFTFFQLAHSQWYGRDLPEREMEQIFADYLFTGKVPFWVRHLSRSVQSRQLAGAQVRKEGKAPGPDQPASLGMTFFCLVFYIILSGLIVFL